MKTKWSTIFLLSSLLALVSCGAEQFGTTPQNVQQNPNALQVFHQSTCAGSTLVKPEVDILYVVDNSLSTHWIPNLRPKIQTTINSISSQFDYRIIMTPLLETASEASGGGGFSSGPGGPVTSISNSDYQILSNSVLPLSIPESKKISSASQFEYGPTQRPAQAGVVEKGLIRTINFINNNDVLFRDNAHLLIVLVSNGKDRDVYLEGGGHSSTVFNSRRTAFTTIKSHKDLQSLRFFSLTANQSKAENPACPEGTQSSVKSYGDMSTALGNSADHHDICGDMNSVFTAVNNSIQQVTLPHSYKYWPISVAEGQTSIDPNHIRVIKTNPTSGQTVLTSGWSYLPNPSKLSYNTRILPTVGEPSNARHLIEFSSSNYPTYPDCISVQVQGLTEYFGFFVIPKIPLMESVVIKVNGATIPSSAYEYIAYQGDKNIKVAHGGYPATPEVKKSGYMFKVTNPSYYYKSGDNVEIHYIPASI